MSVYVIETSQVREVIHNGETTEEDLPLKLVAFAIDYYRPVADQGRVVVTLRSGEVMTLEMSEDELRQKLVAALDA